MAGALIIYLLRDLIIEILFSSDFLPMGELFAWQLTGDVIKIGSWVLAYVMLGRAMVKVFIITEISFSVIFVLLSWLLIDQFGLVGVAMAYAINYCCYWVVMGVLVKLEMNSMRAKN
jgi:PST family polysaccharide transporter